MTQTLVIPTVESYIHWENNQNSQVWVQSEQNKFAY